MRYVVRFAEINPFAAQYRVGSHDVEIELGQCPVTGILLRSQVENHAVRKFVHDEPAGVFVERVGGEPVQQCDSFINPGLGIRERTRSLSGIPPFIKKFFKRFRESLASKPEYCFLNLHAGKPDLSR